MESMSDIDFAIAILTERRDKLSDPNSLLAEKLSSAIRTLSAKKSINVDCLRAYIADDGTYKGINVDIVRDNGDMEPLVSAEKYPNGAIHVHAYGDISSDEPTYSVQVASGEELKSFLEE